MKKNTISIVMSVYNGSKNIFKQLESIRGQIVSPDEVLVFDDCSTDDTRLIINNYIKKYNLEETWHLFKNTYNKGWKKNFHDGICKASGDFVFPCDQDDIWKSNKLKVMTDVMEKYPSINVLASKYTTFTDDQDYNEATDIESNNYPIKAEPWSRKFMKVKYPGCTYCVRKKYIDCIKKYWNSNYEHDAFLWRLALLQGKLYIYEHSLIYWRIYKKSTNAKEKSETRINCSKRIEYVDLLLSFNKTMTNYLKDKNNDESIKFKYLSKNKLMLEARKAFLCSPTVRNGLKCLSYIPYYTYFNEFLRDLIITFYRKNE